MGKRVLWIEDEGDSALADYAGPVLIAGHSLEIVSDATEAAKRLQQSQYDVVIFDLIINAGSGKEWQQLDEESRREGRDPYLGLCLLRSIFNKGKSQGIKLSIPWLSPEKAAVFTVVADPQIHAEIRSFGIENISVKARSDLSILKKIIDRE